MLANHIWICTICNWEVPHQQGYEPAVPGQGYRPPGGGQGPYLPPQPTYGYGPMK